MGVGGRPLWAGGVGVGAMGSWNAFQKRNARRNRPAYFVIARSNAADPGAPLVLVSGGKWEAWTSFGSNPGRFIKGEEAAKKVADTWAAKLGVKVWTVKV